MYLRHSLADMLYPAVISLAGCSSAEPASVSYSIINIKTNIKQFGIKKTTISKKLKRKTHKLGRWLTTPGSIRTSFDSTQLLAAPF